METGIGAGWTHGGSLPPWMQQSPGFDEADAADRAQDRAALAAALRAEQLPADLFAERFGPPAELTAEGYRLPRPLALAELATARGGGPSRWHIVLERRAVLDDALRSTEDLPAGPRARLAA